MSVFSFFSYKGGSGRTTTTLNTVYYLIDEIKPTRKAPIIIIDADTESYGMSMLIKDQNKRYAPEVSLQGLGRAKQDVFNCKDSDPTDWCSYKELNKFFIPVGEYFTKDVDNNAVLLLRSDVTPSEQYANWETVFAMNSSSGIENRNLTDALQIMVDRCGCTVIFDTPSGTQDMSTFALDNSDLIVCCMRPSVQFERGTRFCFEKLIEQWTDERNRKQIIFCPSAVPFKEMTIDSNTYPDYYVTSVFDGFREQMQTMANDSRGVVKLIWGMQEGKVPGIPEVDRFKWQECCLGKIGGNREDEVMAREKYAQLARLLVRYN